MERDLDQNNVRMFCPDSLWERSMLCCSFMAWSHLVVHEWDSFVHELGFLFCFLNSRVAEL